MTWFRIPMVWQMYGRLDVEADSLQEAIEYALGPESPLPEGSYLDDSVEIDEPCMSSTLHVKVRLKMRKEMPMDRLRQMTILHFNGG